MGTLGSFSLSRNATRFDHDEAAGLDAERAFEYHLLERRMSLEAACVQTNAPSRCSNQRGPSIPQRLDPHSTCSSGRACHPHACSACPQRLCPKDSSPPRLRSSESTVPTPRRRGGSAAAGGLPHACSDCACLPVMPDKPPATSAASILRRLPRGPRRGGPYSFDAAFKLTTATQRSP